MSFIDRVITITLLLAFSLLNTGVVSAGGGPENVLLVVNSKSPASLAVANLFIELRSIPPQNVVYLDNILDRENCPVRYFKSMIIQPVLKTIEERKIGGHIDYIVYSADFPTFVNITDHKNILAERIKNQHPKLFIAGASINSLTYFYSSVVVDDASYMLLDANWYMRRDATNLLTTPFLGDRQRKFEQAVEDYKNGDYELAAETLTKLVTANPQQVAAIYQLARALAKQNKTAESLAMLDRAVAAGWCYPSFTQSDKAFSNLADNESFERLVSGMPAEQYPWLPTRGFSHQRVWGPNGWPNSEPTQGRRLVLSTVLAVTRNRGTSLERALDQIATSVAADGTYPKGKFYFAKHNNVRSKTRQGQFEQAINAIRKLGLEADEITQQLPQNRNVLGVTIGSAQVNWAKSKSRFVPGALSDNLTSHGGVMRANAKQTPLTDFIRHGAAGASGTVVEPLAIAYKFPHAMLHAHYARGCSLAEAFYQSVFGPFQLLIVGDPLCQPWATFPTFEVTGLKHGDVIEGTVNLSFEKSANSPGISRLELFLDGRKGQDVRPGQSIRLETNSFSDGYHELRVVAVDDTPIETRTSKKIGFEVRNGDRQVQLEIVGSPKIEPGQSLKLKVSASFGDEITIMQNSRPIKTVEGDKGSIEIAGETLGAGKTKLRAVAIDAGETVASWPIDVEIQRDLK